jgi:hypothetical protein
MVWVVIWTLQVYKLCVCVCVCVVVVVVVVCCRVCCRVFVFVVVFLFLCAHTRVYSKIVAIIFLTTEDGGGNARRHIYYHKNPYIYTGISGQMPTHLWRTKKGL